MNIVNFGSCNIDYVYKLDHIVKIGETEHSERMDVFPGGKGLNQSIAIAKAGAKVYHAGFIGKDGQLLLDTMKESGVDVSFVKQVNQPNGHAIIQVSEKGENSIFIHTGSNGLFTKEYIDEVLSNFKSGDILLLQNEINDIDYIIKKAYEKGMITVFNPSPIDSSLEKIDFNMISYAVLNEIEGEYLTGCKEAAKIISTLRKNFPQMKIVLTLGDKGCIYHDTITMYCNPAYDVIVVDSTAAGDTFMGYFIASLAEELTPEQTLERACMASALAVSKKGAAPSIPYENDVKTACGFLKAKDVGTVDKNVLLKNRIDAYIENDLQNATLSGLAAELGYSTVYTGNIIKKITQKSFAKYLQERRCSAASRYLLETELPVSDIINKIGYSNESFFRDKFKELYSVTPLNYRKTLKNKIKN